MHRNEARGWLMFSSRFFSSLTMVGIRNVRILFIGSILCVAAFLSFGRGRVLAATYQVTKYNDTNDGVCSPTDCSLREAIIAANAAPGADTIFLPAGLYTLSILGAEEDNSATGDLDIGDDLTILGENQGGTTIDGGGIDRAFHITNPSELVTFSYLTIQNGFAAYIDTLGGGGILNLGNLTLTDVHLKDNTALRGGGLRNSLGLVSLSGSFVSDNIGQFEGGGIYNNGELTVFDTIIENNSAGRGAGIGNSATVVLNRVGLRGNNSSGLGGGIFNDSIFELYDVSLIGNTASSGGGFYNQQTVMMERVTLDHNQVNNDGAGLYTNDTAILTDVTISDNYAFEDGGGIYNDETLTILNSTIYSNTATSGGGIYNDTNGTINFSYSIIAHNLTDIDDGNCWNANQLISEGYNIADTGACELGAPGDLPERDPELGPLQDNGGWTYTRAPLVGLSPAIDIGSGSCAETDQRLVVRAVDADQNGTPLCDSGAVEVVTAGYLAFSPLAYTTDEGNLSVTIQVERLEGTRPVSVSFATVGGTARVGSDNLAASGVLSWGDGDTSSKTFSVTILDDNYNEDDESIDILLQNPIGGAGMIFPNHRATITIFANDPLGLVEKLLFLPALQR